ncbi:hypothetical protein Tsubulata_046779 [Turnera subulata]|uniref:Uncharacterized protein n=1 Tax=Turnera subulata TaxID=218843 RepID=A0A9Q0FWG1_9ROSI|nr:hypothetical protein Tsubulata_046779 [Turnera subulata]
MISYPQDCGCEFGKDWKATISCRGRIPYHDYHARASISRIPKDFSITDRWTGEGKTQTNVPFESSRTPPMPSGPGATIEETLKITM